MFAAQHNIPADFLEQRKEFAGCGSEIELFTCDTQAVCEHCGFVVYNDTLSCVQWCKYARQCVGDAMYEQMMAIAERQDGAELSIGYADAGTYPLSAVWLAD